MNEKEKDLLIKDLCARLPYGVKCAYFDIKGEIKVGELFTVWCNEKRVFIDKLSIDYDGGDCIGVIPYLFPLSSMTKEQLFEVQEILGKNEIEIEDGFLHIVDSDRNVITYLEILALLEWFYKNHFDIYGLIPMELAIDATGLDIY